MGKTQAKGKSDSAGGQVMGERIKAAREARNLTSKQLGNRMGVTAKTINNWESGKSMPRPNKLVSLAGIMGVSMAWLMQGDAARGRKVKLTKTSNLERKVKTLVSLHERTSALLFEVQADISRLQSDMNKAK